MRISVCAVAVLLAAPVWADEKPAVRVLALKGVKLEHAKAGGQPQGVEIKSADELAKSALFADDAGRDALKKQTDFAKDKLVVFAWSGSGGDKLAFAQLKDGKAVFTYAAGATDDLRHHGHAFAVPKDAPVEVKE